MILGCVGGAYTSSKRPDTGSYSLYVDAPSITDGAKSARRWEAMGSVPINVPINVPIERVSSLYLTQEDKSIQ